MQGVTLISQEGTEDTEKAETFSFSREAKPWLSTGAMAIPGELKVFTSGKGKQREGSTVGCYLPNGAVVTVSLYNNKNTGCDSPG